MTARTGKPTLPLPPRRAEAGKHLRPLKAGFTALAVLAGAVQAAQEPEAEKLTVVMQARPTTCYVGQTVDVSIGAVAAGARPEITLPHVAGADLMFVRNEQVPLSASGIGDMVWEKNLYRALYRLIPRRAGTLTVGRAAARLGDRTGASDALRLIVREVPRTGRPASFLGSVGRIDIAATASPASVSTGQTLDYRIVITGPGARGVTAPPTLDRWSTLPVALQIERLPDARVDVPPSHTFVFRLRPTRPGETTLPPVPVATFDPSTGQFQTHVTQGIPLRVSDVAPFDAARLRYATAPAPQAQAVRPAHAGRVAGMVTAATFLIASGIVVSAVRLRGKRQAIRGLARRVVRQVEGCPDPVQCGRVITEGLARYLRLTTGRPPGALTPEEAGLGVTSATGSNELAERAIRLVARCDLAQYGTAAETSGPLWEEGRSFFKELAMTSTARLPASGSMAGRLTVGQGSGSR